MPSEEGLEPDPVEPNTPIDAFTTLGGVPQDGGDISAPDITGGTITGARIVSEDNRGQVVLANGQFDSTSGDGYGNVVYEQLGHGSLTISIQDGAGMLSGAVASLDVADRSQMGGDEFSPRAFLRLEAPALVGLLTVGDNCLEIYCRNSRESQASVAKLWGDGGVRIGNDHGFLHITPEGAIRVERDGQRINLI